MLLELFVAVLRAYVFALLTAVFIGMMQTEHHWLLATGMPGFWPRT
jgi:hypothetical protein